MITIRQASPRGGRDTADRRAWWRFGRRGRALVLVGALMLGGTAAAFAQSSAAPPDAGTAPLRNATTPPGITKPGE